MKIPAGRRRYIWDKTKGELVEVKEEKPLILDLPLGSWCNASPFREFIQDIERSLLHFSGKPKKLAEYTTTKGEKLEAAVCPVCGKVHIGEKTPLGTIYACEKVPKDKIIIGDQVFDLRERK